MSKTLTLENLAPLLSKYLKFVSSMDKPFDEYGNQPIHTFNGIEFLFGDWCLVSKERKDAYSIGTCKIIARSLSSLTKQITYKGETFVPLVELCKMATNVNDIDSNKIELLEDGSMSVFGRKGFTLTFTFDKSDYSFILMQRGQSYSVCNQLALFRKLCDWKFALDIDPELYIDVETLETNPY